MVQLLPLGAALILVGLVRLGGFCAGRRFGGCLLVLALGAAAAHLAAAAVAPGFEICRSPNGASVLGSLLPALALPAFHCGGLVAAAGATTLMRNATVARLAASGALVAAGGLTIVAA